MQRVAAGDVKAFERLYERFAKPVYGLLWRMTRDHGRAEDLLQEVFLILWRQAERYDAETAPVLTWLMVIARHRALDRLRSAEARREYVESDQDLEIAAAPAAVLPSFEMELSEEQSLQRVRQALPRLTPEERQVIELAYFEGCTQAEISARLGSPLGTVKTRARSGLAKLRTELG
ncbi:MAG TPA: sigma-70 family RNA polymerase sigma factor [Terriglobales bacterium]|nr:sigma-70 family RNA polymerase sigma factor [Terriglobales bacterium]